MTMQQDDLEQGWVKIHRGILKWEWWDDRNTRDLFIYCILRANHEDVRWHGKVIKRGTFVAGRKTLAKGSGISERQVRTSLARLKMTGEVTTETTTQYTIITICNYDKYQVNERVQRPTECPTDDQQMTNERPANDHKQEGKELKNNNMGEQPPSGGVPPVEVEEPKNKKKYSDERVALHGKMKLIFCDKWKELYSTDYYWTASDSSAIANIAAKIISKVADDKKKDYTFIEMSWLTFLHLVIKKGDSFTQENLSPRLINSKFNNLYNLIKNDHNTSPQPPAGTVESRLNFTQTTGGIETDI